MIVQAVLPSASKFDEVKIRKYLSGLKSQAAEIVAPLVAPAETARLRYEGRDKLAYLACMEIEDSDVPWVREEDNDMGDE